MENKEESEQDLNQEKHSKKSSGARKNSDDDLDASGFDDDVGVGVDLDELLKEAVKEQEAIILDELEDEEESEENESSPDEESIPEDPYPEEESDKSEESEDEKNRKYLIDKDSFTHLKDPGLQNALDSDGEEEAKKNEVVERRGKAGERDAYKKLCHDLGVIPCSKFMKNIHNEVMDLSYMGLNEQGVLAVCRSLMENYYVKKLFLRGNDVGVTGGEALADLILNNVSITHLDIARTNILKSIKIICESAIFRPHIEVLDISRNDLSDKEMEDVGLLLKDPSSPLEELYMSRNYVGDKGTQHLASGLEKNKILTKLDLSFNRITGDKDGLSLFTNLSGLPRLSHLELQGNSIKDSAGKAVSKLMSDKSPLQYLDISYNLLSHKSSGFLGKSFAASKTMITLIAGPNRWNRGPLTQGDLVPLLAPLRGELSNSNAAFLDLCYITPIRTEFMKTKAGVDKVHPELKIVHGETFGLIKPKKPDLQNLVVRRAQVVCENFETPLSMLINELRTEPEKLSLKLFKKFIKSCNLYKDKKMTKEFINNFKCQDSPNDIDCKRIIEIYDIEFPPTHGNAKKKSVKEEEDEDEKMGINTKNMAALLKW